MIDSKWTQVATVPPNKLKTIGFGALKGKSDINPQWRIKAMTEVYGLCGVGWYHELQKNWTETASNGVVMAFCLVNVYIKVDGEWSKPICGMGGNEIVSLSKGELRPSDEGWKMAYTDALGTALKSIGVASEIYEGNFDGSKYQKQNEPATKQTEPEQPKPPTLAEKINKIAETAKKAGITDIKSFATKAGIATGQPERESVIDMLLSEPELIKQVIETFKNETKEN